MDWVLYDIGLFHKRVKSILRKQLAEVFYEKKEVLKNSTKLTGKDLRQSLFFNKVACLQLSNV